MSAPAAQINVHFSRRQRQRNRQLARATANSHPQDYSQAADTALVCSGEQPPSPSELIIAQEQQPVFSPGGIFGSREVIAIDRTGSSTKAGKRDSSSTGPPSSSSKRPAARPASPPAMLPAARSSIAGRMRITPKTVSRLLPNLNEGHSSAEIPYASGRQSLLEYAPSQLDCPRNSRRFSSTAHDSYPFTTSPRRAPVIAVPSASAPAPPVPVSRAPVRAAPSPVQPAQEDEQREVIDLINGLDDTPLPLPADNAYPGQQTDWTKSYNGVSSVAFDKEAADILQAPIPFDDVEVKPDGILYLPEIKYRRILNKAFGPGGWGVVPRGETIVTSKSVTREWALIVQGRMVSVARGEQDYFNPEGIPTATEGCKSNAIMRCCKDLGVASELWDPRYIRTFKRDHAKHVWTEHIPSKKRKQMWLRKDDEVVYPNKEVRG